MYILTRVLLPASYVIVPDPIPCPSITREKNEGIRCDNLIKAWSNSKMKDFMPFLSETLAFFTTTFLWWNKNTAFNPPTKSHYLQGAQHCPMSYTHIYTHIHTAHIQLWRVQPYPSAYARVFFLAYESHLCPSLPKSGFNGDVLVSWNRTQWKYLHHGNQQMSTNHFSQQESQLLNIYQDNTGLFSHWVSFLIGELDIA